MANLLDLERLWYNPNIVALALTPFSWLYGLGVVCRRQAYRSGLLPVERLPVPLIVVGNLTVGGTGKTPLVIWLSEYLREQGFRPGVIARGYLGMAKHWPQQVRPDSDPVIVGDEAVVLARRCACPVAAGPRRHEAAAALIEYYGCDVILSDDGLQHFRLDRDIDIAVVDGVRRLGNKRLLPAGPLREPAGRLGQVDLVVTNGIAGRGEFAMEIVVEPLRSLRDEQLHLPLEDLRPREVHAVAGIAHPERFFALLRARGFRVHKHPFPDHHAFVEGELRFDDGLPVIMTEKDAVKCRRFARSNHWYLPISTNMPEVFATRLMMLLRRKSSGQKAA